MEAKNDEISLIPVKITKNNITKIMIETFVKDIDYEKKYTLNDLKKELTHAFKSVKQKKNESVKKKEPSKYNIYIKEIMGKLKIDNPEKTNKEILKMAAQEWQLNKEKTNT
tara:strand:- start:75 stop:407 length:333 start_codon:yes stop_codon:yes gene_type:complete